MDIILRPMTFNLPVNHSMLWRTVFKWPENLTINILERLPLNWIMMGSTNLHYLQPKPFNPTIVNWMSYYSIQFTVLGFMSRDIAFYVYNATFLWNKWWLMIIEMKSNIVSINLFKILRGKCLKRKYFASSLSLSLGTRKRTVKPIANMTI